ncbi:MULTISPECIES: acid phosphatase [unclassified Caballeronia]|uniref:acid phosphatase n=1 Tax=unclassified Caballeronia TaxID=2646786 RepID=UPI0028562DE4|nr:MULTISPECIES: acid phosphatase [unclassified Caballeronia]MDR5813955.1 acid phosphatase [Caballeronia sp. LZ033]MDR5878499.1 acid phosphatase [Caballeronia sp. LZ032]
MNKKLVCAVPLAATVAFGLYACGGDDHHDDISSVKNVVVIYAENRSFDNLYGHFPGANGLQNVTTANSQQLDRDGSVLATLPTIWTGLTATGVTPAITAAMTTNLPNAPFAIDDPKGFNTALNVTTRDLYHRFYENQMQIDGGKNDKFVAWGDSGALVMGHYDTPPEKLPLYKIAQQYTLADNFFMGAFGGSFLNHQWLICACTPVYPNADTSVAKGSISSVNPDGVSLKLAKAAGSALDANTSGLFVNSGNLTPDFYAVNTMQPPYQPSGNKPAAGGDANLADPTAATTLPPQTQQHIGDLLNKANVSWAWYGGSWGAALADRSVINGAVNVVPDFQTHHQPFNYFADLAPGTTNRTQHLLDGGTSGAEFIKAIDAGTLPQVSFYKPQGNLNEHAGYTDVASGDQHIADLISHLQKSPQWKNMVVVVTYDENGGFWDHVAPPKGDRWGPGTRIPALIVSPYSKKGFVDHTQYDTTSILRFITKRFNLPSLPGLTSRDAALTANGAAKMGDLTNALDFSQ